MSKTQKKHAPRAPSHDIIRLVALDLDGTLLSSRKTITPLTHTVLRAVIERGVKVVLATARPPRSVRTYFEALKLDTPTINYNGALIWDEARRKPILHTPMQPEVARRIIAFGRKRYPKLLVSIEILDKWYTDHYSDAPEYSTETARQFTPDFIGPLAAFLTVPLTKLMLLGHPDWIADLENQIPLHFAGEISHTRSDPHLLQLMSPEITKALALAKVAEMLGITARETLAIGDAPNDIEMLQWAGLALAPENAWDQTKKIVHAIIPSNNHDGIAHALQRYVLKP